MTSVAETRALSSVFIGNVPLDVTEEQLKDLFSECGPVVNFKLFCDKTSGRSQGYAVCEYKEPEIAVSATRNLGNFELKGQVLRVDIAASEKCRQDIERLQGTVVDSSEINEATDGSGEKAPEEISKAVASLPAEQMFELMKQMKMCIENNPQEARNLLLQNPQLAYALLQAQVIMRIVDPDVAMKILDRNSNPVEAEPKPTEQAQNPPATQAAPPANPVPMTSAPVHSAPLPVPPVTAMGPMNPFTDQDMSSAGDQDLRQLPLTLGDRDLRVQPPLVTRTSEPDFRDQDFRTLPTSMPVAPERPFDPRFRNMPVPDVPQPVPPPFGRPLVVDPRTSAGPARVEDPRRAGMAASINSRLSAAGPAIQSLGPPMAPMGILPGAAASILAEDQEKAALIMQVLQLTDQQIAQLPAEQRTSIMVLKEQLARSQLL